MHSSTRPQSDVTLAHDIYLSKNQVYLDNTDLYDLDNEEIRFPFLQGPIIQPFLGAHSTSKSTKPYLKESDFYNSQNP